MRFTNDLHSSVNRVKSKLKLGNISLGVFLLSANSLIAEVIANHALDWILIDLEASHGSKMDVLHILQALNGYDVLPLVRISYQEKALIESALDLGAKGVMIPKVDNAVQAEQMSKSCYYPPKGSRGMNCIRASSFYMRSANYLKSANSCILSIIQIESVEGLANIEQIAKIETVDILFLGLGDLAASYGQVGNIYGEVIDKARKRLLDICFIYNKIPGIFAHDTNSTNQYVKEGFKFIAIGNDIKFLNQGVANSLSQIKVYQSDRA